MSNNNEDVISRYSYITYIPLLGAAVAITFDIGYFAALNVSFFTIFSLSEHILFAIEAFPVAVMCLLVLSVVAVITGMKLPLPSPDHGVNSRYIALLVIPMLFICGLVSYILYSFSLVSSNVNAILIGVIGVEVGLLVLGTRSNIRYKSEFGISMILLMILTFTFNVGYSLGTELFHVGQHSIFPRITDTVTLKKGLQIRGRIIRSGERGVLIYDSETADLRFILWEAIGSIEASRSGR
jgi:hypothetical protein